MHNIVQIYIFPCASKTPPILKRDTAPHPLHSPTADDGSPAQRSARPSSATGRLRGGHPFGPRRHLQWRQATCRVWTRRVSDAWNPRGGGFHADRRGSADGTWLGFWDDWTQDGQAGESNYSVVDSMTPWIGAKTSLGKGVLGRSFRSSGSPATQPAITRMVPSPYRGVDC